MDQALVRFRQAAVRENRGRRDVRRRLAFTRPERVQVAPNCRRVITLDELIEQPLLKGGHRQYLL
jgi:hypothetical protein